MQGIPLYTIEKVWKAVDTLASGTASLRQRLYDAHISSLHVLEASDFPDALKQEFEAIEEALTWIPVDREDEGTVAFTTNAMSDDEAKRLATRMVSLFYEMVNRYPDSRAPS